MVAHTSTSTLALSEAEKATISAAIAAAEAQTSGEILCVVARASGDYRATSLILAIVLALLFPIVALLVGLTPIDLATMWHRLLGGGWSLGLGSSPRDEAALGLSLVAAAQTLIVIVVSSLGTLGGLGPALTPKFYKRQRVHRDALHQFLAQGIHVTDNRTGVLIYVSLAEHMAEIIADTAIYTKVERGVWSDAIAAVLKGARAGDLTRGLTEAIALSGQLLAQHFPREANDTNELPDRVLLL